MNYQYGDIHGLISAETQIENNILVTGVTGFLGGNYVFWRFHLPGKIYVLVRAEEQNHAWQRTVQSLESAARSYNLSIPEIDALKSKIVCIIGDVTQENCGISNKDLMMLRGADISEIWHCAASLSFEERKRDSIMNTNVVGTERLMGIGKQIGIRRFVYISTAFTAGQASGDIAEELHVNQTDFTNCYEESKNLSEQNVVRYCQEKSLQYTILRPSIVIGPHVTRCSGGTRVGIYGMAKEIFLLRETLKNIKTTLSLVGAKGAKINFVPIDQVIFDMLHIESIDFGEQNIYHLSNSRNNSSKKVLKIVEQHMGTDCLRFVQERKNEASTLEKVFDRKTKFYSGYYKTRKNFLRTLPAHKPLNLEEIHNYMRNYYQELLDEEQQHSIFNRQYINSWDNEKLSVHTIGDNSKPALVIVNAYGMPIDFITPLARRLADKYHIISWDSRWVPSLNQKFDLEKCNSLTHAKDLIAILDHLKIDKSFIVGWSSGVQVCLRAMSEFGDRVNCAVLLNGGVSLKLDQGCQITEYEENIRSLLPKIGKNKRMAKLYCDLIYGEADKLTPGDQKSIGAILTSTDPHLLYMTSMPFRTPKALYRYANMISMMYAEQEDAYTSSIDTPTLVYGGMKDKITHPDIARCLASALSHSTLYLSENEDHFAQFYDQQVADLILEFCEKYTGQMIKENYATSNKKATA